MTSVTGRVKEIKQPQGGYLSIKEFKVVELSNTKRLNDIENIHASVIGMAVDYLTRLMNGASVIEAFKISLLGAARAEEFEVKNAKNEILSYVLNIKGLDDESIINACKAVSFDVWVRNFISAMTTKRAKDINPDLKTIENIRILVERSISFWEKYGPIKISGFGFNKNARTEIITSGDGDYLTEDTMWDFKISKSEPTTKDTLQLLIYYIMGLHSGEDYYKNIKKIGFYNPRLNKVYTYEVNKLSKDTIKEIEKDVIGYK